MSQNNQPKVLVTSGLSHLGSHIILQLLQKGYQVRGIVCDLSNTRCNGLKQLTANASQDLELISINQLDQTSWSEAIQDCTYVCYIPNDSSNNLPKDEMEPMEITKLLLNACSTSTSIQRLVVTSSDQAVIGSSVIDGKIYSEEDWSDIDDPNIQPCLKSKILIEKTAWEFAKTLKGKNKLELVVINPCDMYGPIIAGTTCNNLEIIKKILEKKISIIPKLCLRIVDIRDVAAVHIAAMTSPRAPGNRYLTISESVWVKEIAEYLAEEFDSQGYKISKEETPLFVVKGVALINKSLKQVIPAIGKTATFQNDKVVKDLGLKFRSVAITVVDMAYSAIENGLIKKTSKYRGRNTQFVRYIPEAVQ